MDEITVQSLEYGPVRSLQERAYDTLKERILSGEIPPDTVLSETRVAKDLGMSRTPVREAFVRLVNDGFARRFHGRGVVVLELSLKEVLDVIEVKECFEQYALHRICDPAAEPLDIAALDALLEEQRQALADGDVRRFLKLDQDMHQFLIDQLGNRRLSQWMRHVSDLLIYGGYRQLRTPEQWSSALAEHEEFIEALRRRDLQASLAASRRHVLAARQRLLS